MYENETRMTGEYTADDFERWWLAGRRRVDQLDATDCAQLYENCIYLASAEHRTMTQTEEELRDAITRWADDWNERARAILREIDEEAA